MTWNVEQIPDPAKLYMRVHMKMLPEGKLHAGVFKAHGDGMSTDWEKYSTPEDTRFRALQPDMNGVIALVTGTVRSIENLEVRHAPDDDGKNRAHTLIIGIDAQSDQESGSRKTMIRARLFDHFNKWTIDPYSS